MKRKIIDTSEEARLIKSRDLAIIRMKKLQDEIQAAIRIHQQKLEPLEIADKFIHNMFELMKDGVSVNFPELSEAEIIQKVRDTLSLNSKIKSLRLRGKNLG